MADSDSNKRLISDAEDAVKDNESKEKPSPENRPAGDRHHDNTACEQESVNSNLSSNPSVLEPQQQQVIMMPAIMPAMMPYHLMDPNNNNIVMYQQQPTNDPSSLVAFYEDQMKSHAAAFANAAAGAAWAAAQVASQAAAYAHAHGVPDHQLSYYRRGKVRRRSLRSDNDSNSSSSSNNYKINKKKARSDETLLGKSAVSALYEWCGKRGKNPEFITSKVGNEFQSTVSFGNKEWGQGTGCNKNVAKQVAARQALQNVFPGVKFDDETGLVVCIENYNIDMNKLAISGRPNISKRARGGLYHAETSTTTSEGEDDEYLSSSRQDNQCSVLLHKMVQVDSTRIPEVPSFTYELLSPATAKRSKSDDDTSILPPCNSKGGLFRCTGMLKVLEDGQERILTAAGVKGTKRESRHRAAATLLASLFPEAQTEAEVTHAAERFIEDKCAVNRAVNRALKQRATVRRRGSLTRSRFSFSLARASDPALPQAIKDDLRCILGSKRTAEDDLVSSVNAVVLSDTVSSAFQKASRKQQVDNMIESALQKLNDHDEEGRSLPEELTVNDVGRTILRRAEPGDLSRITRLFGSEHEDQEKSSRPELPFAPPSSAVAASSESHTFTTFDRDVSVFVSQWWNSSSSIVLLLCRAIAAYEDPPLGCAVLTLGFSMEEGRVLRLAKIASEPHLPQERFLECLANFSRCMGCVLESEPGIGLSISVSEAASIAETYLTIPATRSTLQSVREEPEEDDASAGSNERLSPSKRRSTQPSKRSRFE